MREGKGAFPDTLKAYILWEQWLGYLYTVSMRCLRQMRDDSTPEAEVLSPVGRVPLGSTGM